MLMKASMPRLLTSEILDGLDEHDPRAVQSRRDLRRINHVMGTVGIIGRALKMVHDAPQRMIEFGAGDGELMLHLAARLSSRWPKVHVVLLDCKDLVAPATREGFAKVGWTVETLHMDIEEWIDSVKHERFEIAVANLFIHHFNGSQISRLFDAVSRCADVFIACEPRRARFPLIASHLVGLLGANEVTRDDAVLSVKAGFNGRELSDLWAADVLAWELDELDAGLFSHLFLAYRHARHEA